MLYIYELTDILFVIKSLKKIPTDLLYPYIYLQFNESGTRSSNTKLCHRASSNAITPTG